MARKFSVILALGFVVLAGCAEPGEPFPDATSTSPSPSMSARPGESTPPSPQPTPSSQPTASSRPGSTPPLSATPPPTLGTPNIEPQEPTYLMGAYWAPGTVTRGGAGPCYGLLSDGGVEFALYSRAGIELVGGEQVRVRVRAASFRIDCGSGQLMSLLEVERG